MIPYSKLFYYRSKGWNNQEIADELGFNRVSVSRKMSKLKEMSDKDFKVLLRDCLFLEDN